MAGILSAMLGAIVGDIVGSVYELDNHRRKDFPLFREDSTFTDDTIFTIILRASRAHRLQLLRFFLQGLGVLKMKSKLLFLNVLNKI